MKNLKFLFGIACLFVASFSFTSCLDSDSDDYSLSPEQYTQYMKQIMEHTVERCISGMTRLS